MLLAIVAAAATETPGATEIATATDSALAVIVDWSIAFTVMAFAVMPVAPLPSPSM